MNCGLFWTTLLYKRMKKMKMYSSILHQRIWFHDQLAQPVTIPVVVKNPELKVEEPNVKMEQDIVESFPVHMQGKAKCIFEGIKEHSKILSWNKDWHLVYEGKPVQGTNIVDLVDDLLHQRKGETPPSIEMVITGLKRINLPATFIENKTSKHRWKDLNHLYWELWYRLKCQNR